MNDKRHTINLLSQKMYWLDQLSGDIPKTSLPLDYIRSSRLVSQKNYFSFDLSRDLSQVIIQLTQGSYLSTYWLLLSASILLLQKYTNSENIIVGIPIHEDSGTKSASNNNNIIPLPIKIKPQLLLKDFLFQVKDEIINAYNNQSCDFSELINLLNISTNKVSICDVVVLLENIHNKNNSERLNNEITVSFSVQDKIISGTIEYQDDLFNSEIIKLFGKLYINLIESIVENIENQKIVDIVFLKDIDKYQLLNQFNNNIKEYPIERTINQLFEEQVHQTPNKIAVIHQSNQLTYQELNSKANQLAKLLRQLGVHQGEFIGIFKDRDINFLIAILAIYKAGGAYVPIDSTYPSERIKYMLSNSEVKILLTDFSRLDILKDLVESCSQLSSIICLDDAIPTQTLLIREAGLKFYSESDFAQLPNDNINCINNAVDPAYMLYTSGSTGFPKGAIVRHDGAINHIYAQFDALELDEEFTFLQNAPSSTDISVWQFLAPLLIGGKTIIVDSESGFVPDKLLQVLQKYQITVVELVPVVLGGLIDYVSQLPIQQRELPDLKWMMVVGEPVSVKRVNQWLSIYPKIGVADAYGPTEAADDITQYIIDKPLPENQRTVPIGKPLANLNIYILDAQMQLLPIGVPGEICVSGIGVGDGYWRNEEKTKLAFVPNPFLDRLIFPQNHQVIYKTGDLGRWLADGNIEFLGRIDNQVKIRGFRLELGEIEAVLRDHPKVQETVVVVREDDPNDKYLVAYFVTENYYEAEEIVEQLRNLLKEKLPPYMMPSDFVWLKKLPVAPSGKVDRRALPAPDRSHLKLEFIPPRTPTEEIVTDIWCQILKRNKIGIHDNFFDLGGHSLLATQVISRLREAFKIELPLRSLFETQTVAGIVEYMEQIRTVQQLQSISTDSIELTEDREEIEL